MSGGYGNILIVVVAIIVMLIVGKLGFGGKQKVSKSRAKYFHYWWY